MILSRRVFVFASVMMTVVLLVVERHPAEGRRRLRAMGETIESGCYVNARSGCVLQSCPTAAHAYCLTHADSNGIVTSDCATVTDVAVARLDKIMDHWQSISWCSEKGCNKHDVCPDSLAEQ